MATRKLVTEDVLLELKEELITSKLLIENRGLGSVEFYTEVKRWRSDCDLLFDFLKLSGLTLFESEKLPLFYQASARLDACP